jgi:hypothetical protein
VQLFKAAHCKSLPETSSAHVFARFSVAALAKQQIAKLSGNAGTLQGRIGATVVNICVVVAVWFARRNLKLRQERSIDLNTLQFQMRKLLLNHKINQVWVSGFRK